MPFLKVGKSMYVVKERIYSIVPERMIHYKRKNRIIVDDSKVINLAMGKTVKSVIFMDSGQVILTNLTAEELIRRYLNEKEFNSLLEK